MGDKKLTELSVIYENSPDYSPSTGRRQSFMLTGTIETSLLSTSLMVVVLPRGRLQVASRYWLQALIEIASTNYLSNDVAPGIIPSSISSESYPDVRLSLSEDPEMYLAHLKFDNCRVSTELENSTLGAHLYVVSRVSYDDEFGS